MGFQIGDGYGQYGLTGRGINDQRRVLGYSADTGARQLGKAGFKVGLMGRINGYDESSR